MAAPARWVTAAPSGTVPAGTRVEVITLTCAPAPAGPVRDSWQHGGQGGDGQWIRLTHPSGVHLGKFRTVEDLATATGLDLAVLTETNAAANCRSHHRAHRKAS